jgi:hypothetical protein
VPLSELQFRRASRLAGGFSRTALAATPEPAPTPLPEWMRILGAAKSLTEAEQHYRDVIKTAHPDVGGNADRAVQLNSAIAAARSHFRNTT